MKKSKILLVKVEDSEPMGSESYLYLATANSALTARVDPHVLPDTGETLELALDPEHLHFFDRENESALLR